MNEQFQDYIKLTKRQKAELIFAKALSDIYDLGFTVGLIEVFTETLIWSEERGEHVINTDPECFVLVEDGDD